ncbi:PAS domain-containing protein [Rhizobium mulingense]|uniref:PAS domain-containing protein n=1 Tax=Rhizobium mulingense TaxID=3031128 RepID=UPI002B465FFD|nr:PAS domain-containing protein [Rhizobium sp. MJ21]MEB3043837.1 PAS domain-containing protein [Rhizobium sp. MJ21]
MSLVIGGLSIRLCLNNPTLPEKADDHRYPPTPPLGTSSTESRFVVVNRAFSERFGVQSTSDLLCRTDFDLHPPEMASVFRAQELEIMRSGEPLFDLEELRIDKSGAPKWLLTTKVPLRNDRNEVSGLVGISRDITDRKLADLLRDGQARVLEMIVSGAPLERVLDEIIHLVESLSQRIFCCIHAG